MYESRTADAEEPRGLALVATIVLAFFGVRELIIAVFVFGAAFALFANIAVGVRIVKGSPKYAGGSIAHVGLAIMFLGFVSSAKYDDKATISLTEGKTTEALGYKLTYTGYKPIDQEKYAFNVHVEKDGKNYVVAPIMYYSEYTKGLMRNPDIANLYSKDFYLAPLSLDQKQDGDQGRMEKVRLRRGETHSVGTIEITFVDFDFPVMEKAAMLEGKEVTIGAVLKVKENGKKPETVTPRKVINQGNQTDKPATYADNYRFSIVGMQPDRESRENSAVEIGVTDLASKQADNQGDVLVVEASVKPYINLVWTGVIVLIVGLLVTIVRRSQEASLKRSSA